MIGRRKVKSRLVYKYIISYLLVFLIPFIFMSIFIYYNSVSGLREEIEQSNLNKLKQVENMTSERIKELDKIASRIAYDPRLTPYMMEHGYYGGEARDELKKYKDNSSIIQELFVYFYNQDQLIYSSNGLYSFTTLTQKIYQFDKWEKESMVNQLHSTQPLILPVGDVTLKSGVRDRMIAFIFPIAPNNPNPYGSVMYLTEESVLTNMIENILVDFKGNTYILDENSEPIVSAVKDAEVSLDQLDPSMIKKQGVHTIRINGQKYSLTTVTSDVSGWTFMTLMDADQFFERVVHRETFVMVLLLTLFLVGLTMAILLGQKQYKPIQGLLEIAKMSSSKTTNWEGENELDALRQTITTVFKDHKSLSETVDLQKPYAKEQLLAKMLKESFPNEQEIDSMLQALNMEMNEGPHFVAIVEFEKEQYEGEPTEERDQVLHTLSHFTLPDATVNGVDLLYQNALAFIISLKEAEGHNQQRRVLAEALQQHVQRHSPMNVWIVTVGTSYGRKNHINRSYIEALAALDHKFAVPQGSLVFFEDLGSPREKSLGYPKEDQIKLAQSLKQGDQVVALETLHAMLSNLVEAEISIQALKYICFDIINTVIKTAMELQLTENMDDFKEVGEFHSVEQLGQRLSPIILEICQRVGDKMENRSQNLRKDLLSYIQEHFKDYDLSLEGLADHFELSVPYLSKFIKEQTGETFTQYVLSLRMEEVKKQLRETNQPIKEIVAHVGYKDVANFTRRFKQLEGVTPGQYRKLNR
ncbi:helix-turn-helix domain-containing protein [Lederbergia sp. NSJ-179]|uniref:helix-turn-helix domain-containing protein n=1 Tax=Lederbergia sp. NSJ-179 TaxID=2931402 RepID=UPI001FD5E0AD|nr:helix-turn-helix domain-containing protein [Lederbergia sp. NSJ-179]MCJ7840605.1 helix-turn-helix domain-containing protein [Lederbergia sp. NSJ-179]